MTATSRKRIALFAIVAGIGLIFGGVLLSVLRPGDPTSLSTDAPQEEAYYDDPESELRGELDPDAEFFDGVPGPDEEVPDGEEESPPVTESL